MNETTETTAGALPGIVPPEGSKPCARCGYPLYPVDLDEPFRQRPEGPICCTCVRRERMGSPYTCPRCGELRDHDSSDEAACVSCGVCALCVPTGGDGPGLSERCAECDPSRTEERGA